MTCMTRLINPSKANFGLLTKKYLGRINADVPDLYCTLERKKTRARTRRVQDVVEDDHDQSSPNTQHGVEKSREMRDRRVEGPRAQFQSS